MMEKPKPQKEHQWLQQLVGAWTWEMEASAAPGQPPQKVTGTERVRSLGGIWVVADGEDGHAHNLITLGYDPQRERFVGTFVSDMMAGMWVYEGRLAADGKTLVLDTQGPDMQEPGKLVNYRDSIRIEDADNRIMFSEAEKPDGTWQRFMTMRYRRAK